MKECICCKEHRLLLKRLQEQIAHLEREVNELRNITMPITPIGSQYVAEETFVHSLSEAIKEYRKNT